MQNHQQNISKQNPTLYKKDHASRSSVLYPSDARILQFPQIKYCDTTNWRKKCIIISIDAEKSLDKIKHPFLIKTLQKVAVGIKIN